MHSRLKHVLLKTLLGQLMVLTAVMFSLYAAAALVIWWMQDSQLLSISAALAGICYLSAALALLGESYFSHRQQAVVGMYWSMMIRSGVPLIAAMMMKLLGGPFVEPPAICYLIAFYFAALIVQVVLSYFAADDAQSAAAQSPSK